ncbi:MAG: hypothetical protein JO329_20990 [Planctomycetaceae bacterium]|nr:hypothetical protein [Planctomycetaceae bacterium]
MAHLDLGAGLVVAVDRLREQGDRPVEGGDRLFGPLAAEPQRRVRLVP